MSVAGRKLTIRLPDGRRLNGAEVVGIHSDPGSAVRDGSPVVTLRTVRGEHVVRAPRHGSAVPLVSVGDTVVAGDPLFILNVDEDALSVSKDLRRRTMMRSGVAAVADARRAGAQREHGPHDRPLRPEPHRLAEPDDESEELLDWMKPGLAMAIYAMAAFLLLPVFSQLGGQASKTEIIIMVGLAVAVAALMAVFLSPSKGRWPRWTVRLIAISWLMLSSAVLFTRVMQPPDFVVAGAGPEDTRRLGSDGQLREMPFGDGTGDVPGGPAVAGSVPEDAAGSWEDRLALGPGVAGPVPEAVRASGVLVGQTDLIPMPWMPLPASLGKPAAAPAPVPPIRREDEPDLPVEAEAVAQAGPDAVAEPMAAAGGDAAPEPDPVVAGRSGSGPELRLPGATPDAAVAGKRLAAPDAEIDAGGAPSAVAEAATPAGEAAAPVGPGPAATVAIVQAATVPGGAADVALSGPDGQAAPDRVATVPALDGSRETDPVRLTRGATGRNDWMDAQIGLVGAPGDVAAGGPGARVAVADAAREPDGAPLPAGLRAVDAASGPAWLGVVEGAPAAPDAGGDAAPVSAALSALPASVREDRAQPVPGTPDPVMPATLRAGETAWMETQARHAEGVAADAGDLVPAGDAGAGEPARWMETAAPAEAPVLLARLDNGAGTIGVSDHGAPAVLAVLEGRPTPSDAQPAPVLRDSPGAAPVIAAISPDLAVSRDPADAPRTPPAAAAPATRMLLYLFFDDPRLDERPGLGDAWAADLPPEIARAVWANKVVAEHGIVQVDNWCGGEGPDAKRAWLSDRIRLLQVRVEIDPDRIDAFEAALPVFGDQPPGFFHNRRPLIGGMADAPLMARARSYLRDMPGGGFFDDAAALTRAMQDAGCTEATWNGGDGPVNAMGAELSSRFGS